MSQFCLLISCLPPNMRAKGSASCIQYLDSLQAKPGVLLCLVFFPDPRVVECKFEQIEVESIGDDALVDVSLQSDAHALYIYHLLFHLGVKPNGWYECCCVHPLDRCF